MSQKNTSFKTLEPGTPEYDTHMRRRKARSAVRTAFCMAIAAPVLPIFLAAKIGEKIEEKLESKLAQRQNKDAPALQ